ncbi:MAG: GNAT family N-acetyltransferase [Anaerolineaceae bacterium]|jgi:ribosomal protein S18 acetylase RimI-like enzyme
MRAGKLLIRHAIPEDAVVAADLIAMTMGAFGDQALGFGERGRTLQALRRFFVQRFSRFSHDAAWIAFVDDRPAGLLLGFPGREYLRRNAVLAWQVWGVYGVIDALRLIGLSTSLAQSKETERDEFYIDHIAVFPDFQRQGIGRELLSWAETLAAQNGLKRLSLIVERGNEPAHALYRAVGFQIVETHPASEDYQKRFHTPGFDRMVKVMSG